MQVTTCSCCSGQEQQGSRAAAPGKIDDLFCQTRAALPFTLCAGHYLPLLAAKLLAKGSEGLDGPGANKMRLKGIIVGNPWTDPMHDNLGEAGCWTIVSTREVALLKRDDPWESHVECPS